MAQNFEFFKLIFVLMALNSKSSNCIKFPKHHNSALKASLQLFTTQHYATGWKNREEAELISTNAAKHELSSLYS